MKYLVLWKTKPPTRSVVDQKDVKIVGKKVVAKWGSEWYEAELIEENEDEAWLDLLEVNTKGEIITSSCKTPEHLIAKKIKIKIDQKNKNTQIKISQRKASTVISNIKSIFSEGEEDDIEEAEERNTNESKKHHEPNDDHECSKIKRNSNSGNCLFCNVYSEESTFEEKFLATAEASIGHLQALMQEEGHATAGAEDVRLYAGYDIFINRHKLHDIKRLNKKDAKAMTRALLREILGEDKLATLSANTVPDTVMRAIAGYVDSNCRTGEKLNLTSFKRCVINFCTSLKEKKKKKDGATSLVGDQSDKNKNNADNNKNNVVMKEYVKISNKFNIRKNLHNEYEEETEELDIDENEKEVEENNLLKKSDEHIQEEGIFEIQEEKDVLKPKGVKKTVQEEITKINTDKNEKEDVPKSKDVKNTAQKKEVIENQKEKSGAGYHPGSYRHLSRSRNSNRRSRNHSRSRSRSRNGNRQSRNRSGSRSGSQRNRKHSDHPNRSRTRSRTSTYNRRARNRTRSRSDNRQKRSHHSGSRIRHH